ncbi:hypothetical protein B0A49_06981 [Cryomyces minteri]|uniref:Xylanolytic transcriptional activator regulatory domain-containing protein n=1 Tax=Cryomyces minteri TaxID=331657 RepID=A0A4U0WTS0_9PEZI|nr:hypothetical protein B0A49_06981 [Cryomyces minteri]
MRVGRKALESKRLSASQHLCTPAFGHSPSDSALWDQQMLPLPTPTFDSDALAQDSHYALQELQQQNSQSNPNGRTAGRSRDHLYGTGNNGTMSRQFGLGCESVRERKKRGKASRKDLAQQNAVVASPTVSQANPMSRNGLSSEDQKSDETPKGQEKSAEGQISGGGLPHPSMPPRSLSLGSRPTVNSGDMFRNMASTPRTGSLGDLLESSGSGTRTQQNNRQVTRESQKMRQDPASYLPNRNVADSNNSLGTNGHDFMDEYNRVTARPSNTANVYPMFNNSPTMLPHHSLQTNNLLSYGDSTYATSSPQSQQDTPRAFHFGESPLSAGVIGSSPVTGSPGWLSLPPLPGALYPHFQSPINSTQHLRYPVLQPLLPFITNIIPISLACDLLELYFSSSSSAFLQPQSPYVLGFISRKQSFLRAKTPRACSSALLASMLWVAAQTSESAFLRSPPSARGRICQKLLELTVGLLKPLIHGPVTNDGSTSYDADTVINGVALGGFGMALPGASQETEGGSPGATGALDDVATYIHLATVVSASEYKAASLRWWNAAFSLARELKLGRELPPNPEPAVEEDDEDEDADAEGEVDVELPMTDQQALNGHSPNSRNDLSTSGHVSEEEREERRRIWWLLYTMDRHLALCYNRPLFLLDIECDGLLQPIDDTIWQAGEHYAGESPDVNSPHFRGRGPNIECTGHSIFGYFLPLMTILGGIVDLNHARNHPRFGLRFRSESDWDDQAAEISQQLHAYGRSLQEFEARFINAGKINGTGEAANDTGSYHYDASTASTRSASISDSRMAEIVIQTKIVVAYGTHLMHTLHILLNGKWDPISLLDDNDLWISSQSFISATGHAVSAAEAISEILENDPDLSFMPFFFGIYLLQGSFLLLLIADKLQGEASPSVVGACETIVRAHEACVVTLNTEYQRNFRKVMRSALAQVRGRLSEDFGDAQLRRREVLALYRWTGDGTGLAL